MLASVQVARDKRDKGIVKWLSEDPKGFTAGDADLTRYVANNPTGSDDLAGLQSPPALWQNAQAMLQDLDAIHHKIDNLGIENIPVAKRNSRNLRDAMDSFNNAAAELDALGGDAEQETALSVQNLSDANSMLSREATVFSAGSGFEGPLASRASADASGMLSREATVTSVGSFLNSTLKSRNLGDAAAYVGTILRKILEEPKKIRLSMENEDGGAAFGMKWTEQLIPNVSLQIQAEGNARNFHDIIPNMFKEDHAVSGWIIIGGGGGNQEQ